MLYSRTIRSRHGRAGHVRGPTANLAQVPAHDGAAAWRLRGGAGRQRIDGLRFAEKLGSASG